MFGEQYNGDCRIDYAGAFDSVTLTVQSGSAKSATDYSGGKTAPPKTPDPGVGIYARARFPASPAWRGSAERSIDLTFWEKGAPTGAFFRFAYCKHAKIWYDTPKRCTPLDGGDSRR